MQKRISKIARFSNKQRGREKKGAPDIAPKSFSKQGPKWCSVLPIGVIGKSALEIGHFLRRNFWMISGFPFHSRPLCFTADRFAIAPIWHKNQDANWKISESGLGRAPEGAVTQEEQPRKHARSTPNGFPRTPWRAPSENPHVPERPREHFLDHFQGFPCQHPCARSAHLKRQNLQQVVGFSVFCHTLGAL